MNRRQKVLTALHQLVKECCFPQEACALIGVTAEDIGVATGIGRSNASLELNALVRARHVVKFAGRPVRFITRELWETLKTKGVAEIPALTGTVISDPFQQLIGFGHSLHSSIEQAKAAIQYPPQGLACLITGATGTGKTLFAQTMFAFAKATGRMAEDARLVLFNCADYAHNPQLLMSQLFGHIKGAFTGAVHEKAGLVDTAHRSMLFLDEIHRLPPEGQEMLFYLMDYGRYRRLGESNGERHCATLIVGATTENPQSALLHTFLRRFPVLIELPPLSSRPIAERTLLLRHILRGESKKMDLTVNVHPIAVQHLLFYHCPGNIGQLINDVRLACASALFHAMAITRSVTITPNLLPPHVRSSTSPDQLGLIAVTAMEEEWSFSASPFPNWLHGMSGILGELPKLLNKSQEDLEGFHNALTELLESNCIGQDKSILAIKRQVLRTVGADVLKVAQQANKMIFRKSGSQSLVTLLSLSLHLQALKEAGGERQPVSYNWPAIWDLYPEQTATARKIGLIITRELRLRPSDDDVGFWVLLQLADHNKDQSVPPPGIVIIAHGVATATSLAAVANRKVCKSVVFALDIPLDGDEHYLDAAKELVSQADKGSGVLLLVDMEPFVFWGEMIARSTGKKVRTIENVSTALAINAARKSLLPGISVEDLADSLQIEMESCLDPVYSVMPRKSMAIAATCLTGLGAARRIKTMLLDWLGAKRDIEIITVNASGKIIGSGTQLDVLAEEKRLLAVVGSVDPGLDTIPFVSLEELMYHSGWKRLEQIVGCRTPISPLPTEGLEALLRQYLHFLDAAKMVKLCSETFETLKKLIDRPLPIYQEITLTVHLSCMVERVMRGEYAGITADEERIRQSYSAEWQAVTKALAVLEEGIHIRIPSSETAFIVQFLAGNW